ncbi:hypothetical protein [Sulfitobacter sp. M63]|uniref:hypothetical protein n=1 Tax=Sulfitobacter sp. M63 TaxID=2731174 RepID=UPI0023E185E7|nr:hypothetical protein [Sulfitobacter sp. M63]MDF3519157.1 hypothetical protein [Sulfitobacter sp. M63]
MATDLGDTATTEQLIANLVEGKFGEVIQQPEVRSYCLEQLRHAGCTPPLHHIALYCLSKCLDSTGGFISRAARTRLEGLILSNRGVASFLGKIASLNSNHKDLRRLKQALVDDIGREFSADELQIDANWTCHGLMPLL